MVERNGFKFEIVRENQIQNIVKITCLGGIAISDTLHFEDNVAYDTYNKTMYGNLQEYVDSVTE
jgi:hypothetical protein